MSDSELEAGILCASDLKADAQVIHIEKVWQCKHRSLSEELKYTCLSFSLFHLLRRRFFGFECGESSFQPKTHDFVFKGLLLLKNEDGVISYNQAFKVIEVELAFCMISSSPSMLRFIMDHGIEHSCPWRQPA